MKVKITCSFPVGPIDIGETEYTKTVEMTTEEYIDLLNHPQDIQKIEVLRDEY